VVRLHVIARNLNALNYIVIALQLGLVVDLSATVAIVQTMKTMMKEN
jgi:hypothetical protein